MSVKATIFQISEKFYTKYPNSDIILIENLGNSNILVNTKYGQCIPKINNLLNGLIPSIITAVNKHDYFLNQLKLNTTVLNKLTILSKYEHNKIDLFVQDAYGICTTSPTRLLQNKIPNISASIDKKNYFLNYLKITQPLLFSKINIITEYKNSLTKLIVETKYGLCKVSPAKLLKGKMPSIVTAINKTEYFIKMCQDVHGDNYDYSNINYKNDRSKIKVICKTCKKVYNTTAITHLHNTVNCSLCNNYNQGFSDTSWKEQAIKAGRQDYCKVYIIKCTSKTSYETFYKIGKTFNELKKRYQTKNTPFTYEIIKEKYGEAMYISKLERIYHKAFKKYKYIPIVKFAGETECFKW